MAKETVILSNKQLGDREFDLSHAERLFKYQTKKGYDHWSIADGQNYEIVDGSIKPKSGTGNTKKAEK